MRFLDGVASLVDARVLASMSAKRRGIALSARATSAVTRSVQRSTMLALRKVRVVNVSRSKSRRCAVESNARIDRASSVRLESSGSEREMSVCLPMCTVPRRIPAMMKRSFSEMPLFWASQMQRIPTKKMTAMLVMLMRRSYMGCSERGLFINICCYLRKDGAFY